MFYRSRVNQHVTIIRTDQAKLDSLYLRYFLVNPETQTLLLIFATQGSGSELGDALTSQNGIDVSR